MSVTISPVRSPDGRDHRGVEDRPRHHGRTSELLRSGSSCWRASRRRGRGRARQPGEGRVPRHAVATSCARRSTRSSAGRRSSRAGVAARRRPRSRVCDWRGPGGHRAQRARADAAHRRPAGHEPHHLRQAAARRAAGRPGGGRRRPRSRRSATRPRPRASGSRWCSTRWPGPSRGDPGRLQQVRLEPADQRRQVHAQGRHACRCAWSGSTATSRCASPTPARGSGPSSCRTCSSGSARPTPRRPAATAGWGWGWRSSSTVELHGGTVRAKSPGAGPGLDVLHRACR